MSRPMEEDTNGGKTEEEEFNTRPLSGLMMRVKNYTQVLHDSLMAEVDNLTTLLLSERETAEKAKHELAIAQVKVEQLMKKSEESDRNVKELQDSVQRFKERLSDVESENHVLRQQALAVSPTSKSLATRQKTTIFQTVENALHVDINGDGDGVGVGMAVNRRDVSIKDLGDGVLENILFRLPLGTPSSQAKRVCRSWKTILSNRRHNEVGFLFACYDYKDELKDSKLQLCFGEEYDRIDCNRMNYYYSHETVMVMEHCRFGSNFSPHYNILVGSCNGLVCFQKKVPGGQCLREPFAVCNPLTGEFISLKANLGRDVIERVSSGFGYCHSTGEYKVVRLYSTSQDWSVTYTQVYTIGSNKWRDMETLLTDRTLSTESGPGVFANGSLHWLVTDQEERLIILVLDLEDEKFGQLTLPPSEAHEDYDYNELKLLGGNLCWFNKTSSRIEIWVYKKDILNTDNTGWKWDFSIKCDGFQFQPFAVTKSHQILMLGVRHLYCYDPETRTVSSRLKYMNMDKVIPHANSYVSLKDYAETWYGPGCSAVPDAHDGDSHKRKRQS